MSSYAYSFSDNPQLKEANLVKRNPLYNTSAPIPPQLLILFKVCNTRPDECFRSYKVLMFDRVPPLDGSVSSTAEQASQISTAEPFTIFGQPSEVVVEVDGNIAH